MQRRCLIFLALLSLGALYLIVGLAGPATARARSRWRVFGRAAATWLTGIVIYAGTVVFTHSHPNGTHSAKRHIDNYFSDLCAKRADLPSCKKAGELPSGDATAAPAELGPATR